MAWEAHRPTGQAQLERLAALQAAFNPDPSPSPNPDPNPSPSPSPNPSSSPNPSKPKPSPMPNAAAAAAELAELQALEEDCEVVAKRLDAALERLSDVAQEKQRVSSKTSSLTQICEALLAEQTAMEDKVRFMLTPLGYFRDVDRLADVFGIDRDGAASGGAGAVRVQPQSDEFAAMLKRIDAALNFFDA
eukprot:CAMPEP_0118865622 /NCGR_PEP_ID=MMETSP1163-20130328/9819_1 /TAXON_ID=124430 /ORGANISM="Phaeomonas parva, Strain CCMP2877" /LENGTH=189 /DNA_ID=CAMNT_0006799863 /DNA_START=21 /DNA_END=586 /DNA_ORIENTATION=+